MRIVNSRSLVNIINEECIKEPVLYVPELDSLIGGIVKLPEFDVSNFDRDTRYSLERDPYSMSIKKLQVIYPRRFIAAIAFDRLIPDSVPYASRDAAFAFDKAIGLFEFVTASFVNTFVGL